MTQTEKARAYDEALGKAEEFYNDKNNIQCVNVEGMLEEIFPELKESEDEKIRKRIIALVNAHGQGMYKDDMLAWLKNIPYTIDHEKREGFHLGYKAGLEKQGGQKPTDKDMVEALRTEYEKGRADAFAQMQKEWSEEDEKMVANLVDYFKVDDALQYTEKQVVDWLKSLKQKIKGE